MARVLVVGFKSEVSRKMTISAIFDDPTAVDAYFELSISGVDYDPTIATSVRQQIQDSLVSKVNEALVAAGHSALATIIGSDIEYVS